jgi:hypothetical protein
MEDFRAMLRRAYSEMQSRRVKRAHRPRGDALGGRLRGAVTALMAELIRSQTPCPMELPRPKLTHGGGVYCSSKSS